MTCVDGGKGVTDGGKDGRTAGRAVRLIHLRTAGVPKTSVRGLGPRSGVRMDFLQRKTYANFQKMVSFGPTINQERKMMQRSQ